ncbi:MAG TPA: hypothetical protein VG323_05170 [Thermoanaerobaculia bacterium]|nr:hypothetical protein [Thermoanaerobaculia bacterium]
MGDSGLLKTLLFFLCFIMAVLLFMPKDCAQRAAAPIAAMQKRAKPTTTAAATTAPPQGLQIKSTTPPPPAPKTATWPTGVDASRFQYLLEIEAHFAAPKTLSFPKQVVNAAHPSVADALLSLHYIEARPDGTFALTNDGLLHANATDEGSTFSVPVAKRQFERVDDIDCPAGDQCTVSFTWRWQPNAVGQAMQGATQPQHGSAHIIGGAGGWVVTEVSGIDADL